MREYNPDDAIWWSEMKDGVSELHQGKFLCSMDGGQQIRLWERSDQLPFEIFIGQVVESWPCQDCGAAVALRLYFMKLHEGKPICDRCWRKHPFIQVHNNLHLACLTPEFHERTCNYWYTIMDGPYSHTAFNSTELLMEWLTVRGLWLPEPLPEKRGEHKAMHVCGGYRVASYMDHEPFCAIQPSPDRPVWKIAKMSNGRYTLGKVTLDPDGMRTVHYLNPNCHERTEFDWQIIDGRANDYARLIQSAPDIDAEALDVKQCPWCEREMPLKGFRAVSIDGRTEPEPVCKDCADNADDLMRKESEQ